MKRVIARADMPSGFVFAVEDGKLFLVFGEKRDRTFKELKPGLVFKNNREELYLVCKGEFGNIHMKILRPGMEFMDEEGRKRRVVGEGRGMRTEKIPEEKTLFASIK